MGRALSEELRRERASPMPPHSTMRGTEPLHQHVLSYNPNALRWGSGGHQEGDAALCPSDAHSGPLI